MPPQAREEVAVFEPLQRRRCRRVVGGDEIDRAVARAHPRARSRLLALADRRRALERGGAVGDLLGGKRQVVRAGLDRERQTLRARSRAIDASASAEARCTMCTRAPCSRQSRSAASIAACFGGRRPAIAATSHSVAGRRAGSGRRRQRRASPRAPAAAAPRRASTGIASRRSASPTCANSSTPDGHEKALEAEHAGSRERLELAGVARHDAAPEPDVDLTAPAPRRALRVERRDRRRGRDAVERHVDERRDAAGRGRARRRVESFPFGPARLVDVHVRVDEAGHHDGISCIDHGA